MAAHSVAGDAAAGAAARPVDVEASFTRLESGIKDLLRLQPESQWKKQVKFFHDRGDKLGEIMAMKAMCELQMEKQPPLEAEHRA